MTAVTEERYFCPKPWTDMVVRFDGKVFPCCYLPTSAGDLSRQPLEKVWNAPLFQTLRHDFAQGHFSSICKQQPGICPVFEQYLRRHPEENPFRDVGGPVGGRGAP